MEFLKKNYEKVLLGVVLAGLTLAVCLLPIIIAAKRNALDQARTSNKPKATPLEALKLEPLEKPLRRAQSPLALDFTTKHNLINPVVWKKVNGQPIKEQTGKEEGPDALLVTGINPLYLEISYNGPSGAGYLLTVDRQAAPDGKPRKTTTFVSKESKSELITLLEVKGPPDNPTELGLQWNETSETLAIAPGKPFKRVDGYTADLKYPPESNHTWTKQRVGSRPLNFANGTYNIVAITESNVVVSAEPNKKKTTITFHPAN